MNLVHHIRSQRAFSSHTFGPGARTGGLLAHIRKELLEIEQNPVDLEEWIDVITLAIDGAWRAGCGYKLTIIGRYVGDKPLPDADFVVSSEGNVLDAIGPVRALAVKKPEFDTRKR